VLNSPAPGSTLTGSSATFGWTANTTAVTSWWLYVGTGSGSRDVYDSGALGAGALSRTVRGLPTDGRALHARLFYKVGGTWLHHDYQYRAALTQSVSTSHKCTGIYQGTGTYSSSPAGREDALFAVMVKESGDYVLIGYDEVFSDGFNKSGTKIPEDGTFLDSDVDGLGTIVRGRCTETTFNGTFNSSVGSGTFTAAKLPTVGSLSNIDGYYTGMARGATTGTIEGFVSANNRLFFYVDGNNPLFGHLEDGGWFSVQSNGSFSGTTVNGANFNGVLNSGTRTVSGNYTIPVAGQSGTFSASMRDGLPN